MIDIYNTMCILGIICVIVFVVYVYIGKKNFDSKTQKKIADNGIVFNIQSKTEYGIIGSDESKRELIIIYPEIEQAQMWEKTIRAIIVACREYRH